MPSKYKRAVVQLPITPEEFEPFAEWFKENGIVMGRAVLNYLKRVKAGDLVHTCEGIAQSQVGISQKKARGA